MNEPRKLKTHSDIIFKRKTIPAGTILVVGRDIDEKDHAALISMGKEVEEVVGPDEGKKEADDLSKKISDAERRFNELTGENSDLKKQLADAADLIARLNGENEAIIAENQQLKTTPQALEKQPVAEEDPGDKKEKAKK